MPFASLTIDGIHGTTEAFQLSVAAAVQPSGFVAVPMQLITSKYNARYLNPAWLCSPESERT